MGFSRMEATARGSRRMGPVTSRSAALACTVHGTDASDAS